VHTAHPTSEAPYVVSRTCPETDAYPADFRARSDGTLDDRISPAASRWGFRIRLWLRLLY